MGKDQELLDAARSGNIGHVGKLLDQIAKRASGPLSSFRRSPSINSQDVNGYTPLHHASLNGHSAIVRLLLAHDASSDVPDICGSTPLYLAAWAGHEDIVKMLLMHPRKPANPNVQTIDNETPLHCAAQHGHNAALAILLSFGADPKIRNNSFQTALDLAAQFGRLQAVQILLRTHPELIEPYKAAASSPFDLSNFLPKNFAVTSPTKHIFTHTCLHLASRNGHMKIVETLLAAGVDVNILTPAGTALHEAALCGKKSVVTLLLDAGVDPYAKDGSGRTALDLLKDYPTHVTYGISSAIEEFCKNIENARHFKPICPTEDGEDNNKLNFITTTENDIREKSHSIPKSACIKKLNDHSQKSPKSIVGLSSSLTSLEKLKSVPENYLQMRPIFSRKSSKASLASLGHRSDYEEFSPNFSKEKNLSKDSKTSRALDLRLKPIEFIAIDDCENEEQLNTRRYHCVDEYVKMTDPTKFNSNTSTPKSSLPSPRQFEIGDYVNINEIKNSNGVSNANNNNNNLNSITPTKFKSIDANNNKRHSPTPDFPPPSVSQAESTILEFIHPPRPLTKKSNKRRSIHIEYTEQSNDDLETFVMKHINLDSMTDNDEEPNMSLPEQNKTATPTTSSRTSDYVEEYIGDVPFAGLFKGSTLNLANDEIDGIVPTTSRLRSPSLVRSVIPPIPKRNSSLKQPIISKNVDEEFNATKVWEEINTILESIGNEIKNEEEYNSIEEIQKDDNGLIAIQSQSRELVTPKPIKIRNPSELLLGMKSDDTTKWCHSPNTLINGEVIYEVYYLGSTVIRELQGTISTRKSIQKLKRDEVFIENDQDSTILENCNTSTKYLKAANEQTRLQVGIAFSQAGVRFIDSTEKVTICIHNIQNIHCVCQDAEDMRYFAYITKEEDLHYCHVFMVDDLNLATEIILTLGQAFEVAYQLALVNENITQ